MAANYAAKYSAIIDQQFLLKSTLGIGPVIYKKDTKYDVITSQLEDKCIIRIEGVNSFRKEISLVDKWYNLKSPRERILDAQDKARHLAEKLRWKEDQANFEFQSLERL